MKDRRKQSLYFPEKMRVEIRDEAKRLDRSFSWVIQYAWKHGKGALAKLPTMEET